MFKNYLKVSLRNIWKNKTFSFINIFGLALGISFCLVLISILKVQFSYDNFEPGRDRIYRINTEAIRKNGGTEPYASAPFPLGTYLKDNFTYADKVVRLSGGLNSTINFQDKKLSVHGFFTDPDFLDFFGFELSSGSRKTALASANSVVLSKDVAERLFGIADPLGKVISVGGIDDFTVTGVLKNPPGKTHLQFDILASNIGIKKYETDEKIFAVTDNWKNYYSNYVYILLKDNSKKPVLEQALADISNSKYKNVELETRDKGYHFYLQPLNGIVPGPMLSNNMGNAFPSQALWIMGVFACIILISACFNYNSLAIAKALDRTKEIGIRKTAGALRGNIIFQFLTESVVTALFAFALAATIFHFFLKPFFEQLSLFRTFDIDLNESFVSYALFAGFAIVTGIISGIFPAMYISSFRPIESLKNLKNSFSPKLRLRKVLLSVQLGAALVFIVLLFNMYRQMNFIMKADYGFTKESIINIDLEGNDYEKVSTLFSRSSNVLKISGISHSLGTSSDHAIDVRINPADDKTVVRDYTIDDNYIDNLRLNLIAGRDFPHDLPSDRELFVIANEYFINHFKLGTPSGAINRTIILEDSLQLTIIGIVKDFHFRPFTSAIEPLLFRYHPQDITQLNIKTTGIDDSETLAELEQIWKSVDKEHPFSWHAFSEDLRNSYTEYNDLTSMLGLVAMMAVTIAGMGFLGLVIYLLKQRLKEITIRKVLGATASQIARLVYKKFIRLLIIAFIAGLPLTIFVNNILMQEFAYRINPLLSYIIGIMLLLLILFITVATQIVRLALGNPVKNLRTE
jgi:putative ABC transport system permease protein